MSDEEKSEAVATETTEQPAASEKTFTQAEVNKLVGKAREDGRRSAQKQQAAEKPAAEEAAPVTKRQIAEKVDNVESETRAELAALKARMAFDKRASKLGLSDEAQDDLFQLSQVQKPEDLGSWLDAKAKLFSKGNQVSEQPKAPEAPAPKEPAAAPSAPSAVNPLNAGGLTNIFALTESQVEAMTPSELRGHFEKILESGRAMSGAPPRPKAPR